MLDSSDPLRPGGVRLCLKQASIAATTTPLLRPTLGPPRAPVNTVRAIKPATNDPHRPVRAALAHGSQTAWPTCSRGPVRPRQTRGDQAPGHLPPLGGAMWAAALSVPHRPTPRVLEAAGGDPTRWHRAVPPPRPSPRTDSGPTCTAVRSVLARTRASRQALLHYSPPI